MSGGGSVGGGVRVDVNEELKFLGKFKKKKKSAGGGQLGLGRGGVSGRVWGTSLGGQGGCG